MNLSDDQQTALDSITYLFHNAWNMRVMLTGSPGTGKTYLLNEIVDKLRSLGEDVHVTAMTNKAVGVLNKQGLEANTVHSTLGIRVYTDYATGKTSLKCNKINSKISKVAVIIIDEYSMIDRELYGILDRLNYKYLFVGDKYQCAPVNESNCIIDSLNLPTYELVTNHRQEDGNSIIPTFRGIQKQIVNKDYLLKDFESNKNVQVLSQQEIFDKIGEVYLSEEYRNNPDSVKILAYTNNTVNQFNNYVRKLYAMQSILLGSGIDAEFPGRGETVIFNKPFIYKNKVVYQNEAIGKVTDKTPVDDAEHPYFSNAGFIMVTFGLKSISGYYHPDYRVVNNAKKEMRKDYKNNKISYELLQNLTDRIIDIRPPYACTVHKAQGSTYDSVFIDMSDIHTCRNPSDLLRLTYVALSRARENVYIYQG